jgi:hypothetical protein
LTGDAPHTARVALQAASDVPQVGQQAHTAALQQLSSRTPQLLNGRQVYEAITAMRILPFSVDRYASLSVFNKRLVSPSSHGRLAGIILP